MASSLLDEGRTAADHRGEADAYDVDERSVRKAEVDEAVRESRHQGLRDRLADDEKIEVLQQEIEAPEARITNVSNRARPSSRSPDETGSAVAYHERMPEISVALSSALAWARNR